MLTASGLAFAVDRLHAQTAQPETIASLAAASLDDIVNTGP